ncbi:MAG: GNAT family N-acetyltransferase, partial [Rhizobiales bacterium]|nr:GNAT family N-acetyltransferase [Hyphomicrobiales bacterium]
HADTDAVLDLWVASWQAAYPAIDFTARREWMRERLAALAQAGAHRIVADDGTRLVGLVTIHPQARYLDQIAVAPDRQRAGIAGALLAEAKRRAPRGFSLHVNKDNARAIAFYRRHGFAITGEDVNARSVAPTCLMAWAPSE